MVPSSDAFFDGQYRSNVVILLSVDAVVVVIKATIDHARRFCGLFFRWIARDNPECAQLIAKDRCMEEIEAPVYDLSSSCLFLDIFICRLGTIH
jgi:hypothetical protein